eukprot:8198-Heterococcus_DN1.PRE.5
MLNAGDFAQANIDRLARSRALQQYKQVAAATTYTPYFANICHCSFAASHSRLKDNVPRSAHCALLSDRHTTAALTLTQAHSAGACVSNALSLLEVAATVIYVTHEAAASRLREVLLGSLATHLCASYTARSCAGVPLQQQFNQFGWPSLCEWLEVFGLLCLCAMTAAVVYARVHVPQCHCYDCDVLAPRQAVVTAASVTAAAVPLGMHVAHMSLLLSTWLATTGNGDDHEYCGTLLLVAAVAPFVLPVAKSCSRVSSAASIAVVTAVQIATCHKLPYTQPFKPLLLSDCSVMLQLVYNTALQATTTVYLRLYINIHGAAKLPFMQYNVRTVSAYCWHTVTVSSMQMAQSNY